MEATTTAQINLIKKLSPEALTIIKELAEIVKPLVDNVHQAPQVSKNYYAEYMGILSRSASNKGIEYIKLMAITLLYLGCNPDGVNNAVKLLSN